MAPGVYKNSMSKQLDRNMLSSQLTSRKKQYNNFMDSPNEQKESDKLFAKPLDIGSKTTREFKLPQIYSRV